MEETKDVSLKGVALKYGVINALIGIIFFVLIDFAGLNDNSWLQWVGALITAAVMYFAHKEFISGGDGYMNYSQGLGLGTLMVLVSSVISSVFTFIYVQYINPAYIDNIKDIQRAGMEEQGMSDAQIEQAMEISGNFMTPTAFLIIGIVVGVFIGFVIALIVSAITKKSRPEFE